MGNKFVLADPNSCVGCKACMAACLVKHYVPGDVPIARLNVVKVGDRQAPILCHHCENAPCAAACPTGALYNMGDHVAVNMSRCIGCRSCVVACPYGAVDVKERYDADHFGGLVLGASPRAAVVKCDRCTDRAEGPACVAACTSHALHIVDSDEINMNIARCKRAHAAAIPQ